MSAASVPTPIFHALPDAAFRVDRRGVIAEANLAAAHQFAMEQQASAGRLIQDASFVSDGPQLALALEQARSQRITITLECRVDALGHERHHELRVTPIDESQLLVLVRDITDRKQVEAALRETDAQFRVVTQNITDAFWIRSPDMREVRYVSPAFERIWGRPASYLYSHPLEWVEFIAPEDREHVVRTFSALTGEARTLDVEYRIIRPDGEHRWVRVRGFQVRDEQGQLFCNTGIVTDVTERKLAQAALGEAHKQLLDASRRAGMAEIATNVLHNVGTILNSVTVSAGVVRNALRTSRAQGLHQALALMEAHADDMAAFLTHDEKGRLLPQYLTGISRALMKEQSQMIDEMEHLARSIDHIGEVVTTQQSYAGKSGVLVPARVDQLVEDALRITADALKRQGVTVTRDFARLPRVNLDRTELLQVLINLIGNACDAMHATPPAQRRITVGTEVVSGSRLRLWVKDEGEGIPELNLTRIFAHGFTTRKHGHGFGLHSCAQAVAQMGGALTVHSDGVGRGATFTIELSFTQGNATK